MSQQLTRLFGMIFAGLAIGAIAAAPLAPTTQTNRGWQEEEGEQEEGEQEEGEQEEGEEEDKKYTTNEVMKLAHKDGLLKKVATGEASDDEKKQLVIYYKAMAKNKPPAGEEEDWKERNKVLIEAAEAAVKGEEDASDRLMKASNCKACHDPHKRQW